MPKKESGYLSAIKDLPLPTRDQTARFASYVSNAHSWYKHLSPYPRVPLYFILNPTAAMTRQVREDKSVRYVEKTSDTGFHYNYMKTSLYRERFGYWDFRIDESYKPQKKIEAGIETEYGVFHGVPEDLLQKGRAGVSAFMSPESNIDIWNDSRKFLDEQGLTQYRENLGKFEPDIVPESLAFVHCLLKTKGWFPKHEKDYLNENRIYDEAFKGKNISYYHVNLPEEQYELAEKFGGGDCYPEVLEAVEILRTMESRERDLLFYGNHQVYMNLMREFLPKEDCEALLKIWKKYLSLRPAEESLDSLMEYWETTEKTRKSLAMFEKARDMEAVTTIKKLVRGKLARIIAPEVRNPADKNILERTKREAGFTSRHFKDMARKYYPLNKELENMLHFLVNERIHQLASMKKGMDGFLDAIRGKTLSTDNT